MNNNNNNLLELGGSVDLIATAICDFDTPTKHYKEGDIVLNLEDLDVQVITSDRSHRSTSKKLDLDYGTLTVTSLQSSYVPMEKQLYELLGNKAVKFTITKQEWLPCVTEGTIMVTNYVEDPNSIRVNDLSSFRVENRDDIKVTFIHSDEIKLDKFYRVQYNQIISKFSITLDSFEADIPYLKLQLRICGNVDKDGSEGYIFIEKARLHFVPILQFTSSGVTHCTLRFNVIDSEVKPQLVI